MKLSQFYSDPSLKCKKDWPLPQRYHFNFNAWHWVRFTHIQIVISKLFFVLLLDLKPSSDQKVTTRWNCFWWLQRKAATTWTGLSLLDWHQLMVSLRLSFSSQQWLVLNPRIKCKCKSQIQIISDYNTAWKVSISSIGPHNCILFRL